MRRAVRPLELDRPLAVFDLETTGRDVRQDRIVEIAIVTRLPDGTLRERSWRVHPGRPIPPEATAVHGIRDEDVARAKRFAEVAPEVRDALMGCDLAGFNAERFDVPLLRAEFERVGISFPAPGTPIVDVQRIYHRLEPRDLTAAVRRFCERGHPQAHGAEADARAALDVLEAQVQRCPELPADVSGLVAFGREGDLPPADAAGRLCWREGEVVLAFGKHRNRSLRTLVRDDRGYLEWMLRQDFEEPTKQLIAEALSGCFPVRSTEPGGAEPGLRDPRSRSTSA